MRASRSPPLAGADNALGRRAIERFEVAQLQRLHQMVEIPVRGRREFPIREFASCKICENSHPAARRACATIFKMPAGWSSGVLLAGRSARMLPHYLPCPSLPLPLSAGGKWSAPRFYCPRMDKIRELCALSVPRLFSSHWPCCRSVGVPAGARAVRWDLKLPVSKAKAYAMPCV